MKGEKILNAMGGIDARLVEQARPPQAAGRKRGRFKWAAAAACLAAALAVGAGVADFAAGRARPELPVLDISPGEGASGFGFEGYMAHDITQLRSGNPWTQRDRLKTLPVYRNPVEYDGAGMPVLPISAEGSDAMGTGLEEAVESMRARLLEAARRLGLEDVQVRDNAPGREEIDAAREKYDGEIPEGYFAPLEVTAQGGGVEISVEADLSVEINFEPAIALPARYNAREDAGYEDTRAAAEYLAEVYRDLLGMDSPRAQAVGGDRNIYDQPSYQMEVFDEAGSLAERILNYNFNTASFYCNSEGELRIIRLNRPDLSRKVGDYPLISAKEARELLRAGRYITTAPEDMPGEDYVAKVELVYRGGRRDRYFMPYYRFYVELPDQVRENGLKTYGAYYVPAVPEEYLTGMPLWEGQFN